MSMWSRAKEVAARTPETRNRYIDFLRAASITVVVLGHWTVAAAYLSDGELILTDMLHIAPWTQWLTWALQVMPIFFIVGGYSNGISWEAALRDGHGYGLWLSNRLRRLISPIVPLLIGWTFLAMLGARTGVSPERIALGSQAALIPTWFLAVYIMVVITAPATHWLWRRFGMTSFWMFALAALTVDTVAFTAGTAGLSSLRSLNYAFVWLGVHQVGYAWRDGKMGGRERALLWAAGGLGFLIFLVTVRSYPVSMITVPGEDVSNSRPPTFALFALGMFQAGLVLALERPVRQWLERLRPWAATVLVNGTIMTLFLWHLTAVVLVLGLAHLLGDIGLHVLPGSSAWWASRPIWLVLYTVLLAIFVVVFGRFEQTARKTAEESVSAGRSILGAASVCAALAMLALHGIGARGLLGFQVGTVSLVLGGAALVLGPRLGRAPAS